MAAPARRLIRCIRFRGLFLALLLAPAALLSGTTAIRSVTLSGNHAFSQRDIIGWIVSVPDSRYADSLLQRDLAAMRSRYISEGYFSAQCFLASLSFSDDSSAVDIAVRIDEGRRALVGSISLRGNSRLTTEQILERFDLRPDRPLVERILEADLDALLIRYESLGYPFASCRVADIEIRPGPETDLLAVSIDIDEGGRVTIDEIKVAGNSETRSDVVIRETRLTSGEIYQPAKIAAIRPRLMRLNIFSAVEEPRLYERDGRSGLLLRVKEGSTNNFDGIIGYVPGKAAGQNGYVTGMASVVMRNLFGTGRKLNLRWQREDRSSQELAARYVEPWIFGLPVNVGGGFFQRQQDSAYVRRVADFRCELMATDEVAVALTVSAENVIPSSDSTIARVYRSSTTMVGGEITYDSRDDPYSPTGGARCRTDYHYGRKRTGGIPPAMAGGLSTDASVQRIGFDLDVYFSPFLRQVIAVGAHGRDVESPHIDESEMFRFGGMNSLRGYRENQFLGSRLLWSNAEYRFLLTRRSFLLCFVDVGYYSRPADDIRVIPAVEAVKYGYGFGVRLETALGNLGVSIALGQGDSIGQAKIHFGIMNEF